METVANCLHSSEDQGICPKCGQELCRRRWQEEARFTRVRPTDHLVGKPGPANWTKFHTAFWIVIGVGMVILMVAFVAVKWSDWFGR